MKINIFINAVLPLFFYEINDLNSQIGTYTVNGNLTLSQSAVTEFQIKNTSGPGMGNDQLITLGNLAPNGTLKILLDGYIPNYSDAFEIASFTGSLNGTFSTISWPAEMSEGWIIDYGIKVPGKVTVYGLQNVLPVSITEFKGYSAKSKNNIEWTTVNEINCNYFSLELSKDGLNFLELDRIKCNEISKITKSYNYQHFEVKDNINYYRLNVIDLDGSSQSSNIISILGNIKEDVKIFYPNPSLGTLNSNIILENLTVYNNIGKKILELKNIGNSVDLGHLPNGNYFLSLNNSLKLEPFIINK